MGIRHSAGAASLLLILAAARPAAQSEAAWVEEKICFSEGLCAFADPETGLTGYIDKSGDVAIPPRFAGGRPFSGGFAVVWTEEADSEFGSVQHFIDRTGRIVKSLDPMQQAQGFSEGWAQIVTYTGQHALADYVDGNFETAMHLPYEHEFGGSFHDGLAWASVGDIYGPSDAMRFGFIDRTGALVIAAEYSGSGSFDGGIALVSSGGSSGGYTDDGSRVEPKPGIYKIIDPTGKILREIQGDSGTSVEGPRDGAIVHRSGEGLIRVYGSGGALLYETSDYEHIFPYSEGLALAIRREPSLEGNDPMPFSFGYLDKTGAVAIPFSSPLGLMSRYSDGVYAYFDFDSGFIGFKDGTGKTVIEPVLSPAMAEDE